MAINMDKNGVAHAWANQNQDHAKTSNGSFSFYGARLDSYATEIARIVVGKNGNSVALFKDQTYSVTTSAHQSSARSANYLPAFDVEETDPQNTKDHGLNLAHFKEVINENILKSSRARSNAAWYYDQAVAVVQQYNGYLNVFKIKRKFISIDDFNATEIKAKADRTRKQAQAKARKQARELEKRNASNHSDWIAGLVNNYNGSYQSPIRLRVSVDQELIETSRGANIPTSHALMLWRLISMTVKAGKAWQPMPNHAHRVGHYTLDKINARGDVVIGCHDIEFEEMARVAKLLDFKGA